MFFQHRREWIEEFERVVRLTLLEHLGGERASRYGIATYTCTQHGSRCVRIIFGEMLQHVRWKQVDPGEVATSVLETMLPCVAASVGTALSDERPSATDAVLK